MGNTSKIGRISSIKQEYTSENGVTLATSLSAKNYNRFPKTVAALTPFLERDNSRRTGLDENALYIRALESEGLVEEAAQERARVRGFLEHAMIVSGMSAEELGPRSDYYNKMYHEGFFRTAKAAAPYTLRDGENSFDMNDPVQCLTYYWLRVHPSIAPSYEAYTGNKHSLRCPRPLDCSFFVQDEEIETKIQYEKSTRINKAINQLDAMNPVRRLKIAKLLGLPVNFTSEDAVVYVELNNYIKDSASAAKSSNLTIYEGLIKMAEENVEIKYIVAEALDFGVYRVGKGGIIYKGAVEMAKSEEDLVNFLSNPGNQEELLAAKQEIDQKKAAIK